MSLDTALAADREGRIPDAVSGYENALVEGDQIAVALINLLVLYWQATDFGYSATKHLSSDFVSRAGRRMRELFDEGKRRIPDLPELSFWEKYIAWADLGVSFPREVCKDILVRHPHVLTPAMHLFALTEGMEYEREALQLLAESRRDGTERSRYIASVIEGVLKRCGTRQRS